MIRLVAIVWALSSAGCEPAPAPAAPAAAASDAPSIDEPLQPLPEHLDLDARKVELGRKLFALPLSKEGKLSCASCHPLDRAGADGTSRSPREHGLTATNTPTVLNVAFNFRYNWSGAYDSLEEELDAPMARALDTTPAELMTRVHAQAEFRSLSERDVREALAEFQRSLITPNARFDKFLRGDLNALGADEKEGYALFKSYGCASCHQGQNVGGNMFQKLGVMADYFKERGSETTKADYGRFNKTEAEKDRFVFRVPSLRNVALTAPYFHDGSAATLEAAIRIMARYQLGRPLADDQVGKIAAFLRTLTGELGGKPL